MINYPPGHRCNPHPRRETLRLFSTEWRRAKKKRIVFLPLSTSGERSQGFPAGVRVKLLCLFLAVLAFFGVSNITAKPLQVIVSIPPQCEFVKAIGKEAVTCTTLIPPGASPAVFELAPRTIKRLSDADVYFMMGYLPFERANAKRISQLNPRMRMVNTSAGLPVIRGHSHGDDDDSGAAGVDPHVWLSPKLVMRQVRRICDVITALRPDAKAGFEANRDQYLRLLDILDRALTRRLARLSRKTFLVFHPTYAYFAAAYGLDQLAVELHGKQPSIRQLRTLSVAAKKARVSVIFIQPRYSHSLAKSLARSLNAKIVTLDPLAAHYIENMSHIGLVLSTHLK